MKKQYEVPCLVVDTRAKPSKNWTSCSDHGIATQFGITRVKTGTKILGKEQIGPAVSTYLPCIYSRNIIQKEN